MVKNWTFEKNDEIAAKELQGFLPDKIFDIHAHIYRTADLNLQQLSLWMQGPQEVDIGVWNKYMGKQVGQQRLQGGLFFPAPTASCDIDRENDYLLEQLKANPNSRGLILTSPEYPEGRIERYLDNPQIIGFKPYHLFSSEQPTFQSSIQGYLPEWILKIADSRGYIVMLHLVRDKALSDTGNRTAIRKICGEYPNIKLILAHAGRGFHAENTVKGLSALRGIENIRFDMSGICEATAIIAILKQFGPRKLLWGSDFPISQLRGRCVTVGDGFAWLDNESVNWEKLSPVCNPVLTGLESLRALKEACDSFGLNESDLKDIFYDNALRLLGKKHENGTLTQELYNHAKQIIPGGVQLLSKRPEMLAPDQWPAYFREARGCEVWDLDGRHFYDMYINGVGSCLLGFGDPDVTLAVQRRINLGSMSTLNPPDEVELADVLCEIHPWAEQVRFVRSGGEACAAAVRIARATTDRSVIAVCGYHGWYDWYLAANLGESDSLRGHLLPGLDPLGVPKELRGTTVTFRYNNREEYRAVIDKYGDKLAAVIMEPCRYNDPDPGFLEYVRDCAHSCGALLIYDEITIGWRLHFGGAHLKLGINPDIAVFAKALGNGHPIGAVIGTRRAMSGAHLSFISSTNWTEGVGSAAALATIEKMRRIDVPAYVAGVGNKVNDIWKRHGEKYGLPVTVGDGYPCLAHFKFNHEFSEELRTLFTQLMLGQGFLAGISIYPTLAHTDEIIDLYGKAVDAVFAEISDALEKGNVRERLKGPVAHSGFRRLL